ncbi:hypothetical protein LDENG_00255490 [Lucifuga dentata]|nr:hypothetical protein LDENG_00255490 [Lucifuga dentata]
MLWSGLYMCVCVCVCVCPTVVHTYALLPALPSSRSSLLHFESLSVTSLCLIGPCICFPSGLCGIPVNQQPITSLSRTLIHLSDFDGELSLL